LLTSSHWPNQGRAQGTYNKEMMRMKTLKDLVEQTMNTRNPEYNLNRYGQYLANFVLEEDLKQLAIEWIKEIDKALDYSSDKYPEIPDKDKRYVALIFKDLAFLMWKDLEGVRKWIIRFFNMTEDDLNASMEKKM